MKRLLIPAFALIALAGCAGDNAISDYPEVQSAATVPTESPRFKQFVPEQPVVPKVGFKVTVESAEGLVFITGQEASYQVQAQVVEGLKYSLKLGQAPTGMKLESAGKDGLYRLSWKPRAEQIRLGQATDQFPIKFSLAYQSKSSTPESVQVIQEQFEGAEDQEVFQLETVTVKRNMQQPTIKVVETTPIPASINEGASFKFSLEVVDPAADDKNPPRVALVKANGIDSSYFIRDDIKSQAFKQTKPGVWTRQYVFEANLTNIPENVKREQKIGEASASFDVEFGFEVSSSNSQKAATQAHKVTVQLNKNLSAPKLKFALPKNNTALRGVKNTLTIMAESLNRRATVVINDVKLKESLAALPGGPTVECLKQTSTYLQTCTVEWTVDCSAPNLQSKYAFTVEASNSLFGETKVSKQEQVIKLAPVCPQAAAAATKKAGTP